MIADQARMRRDLTVLGGDEELIVELPDGTRGAVNHVSEMLEVFL